MMKGLDNFYSKKAEIIHYWSQGMNVGKISSLTGVPQIRIVHEMDRLTQSRPELLSMHMAAQYRSRRKLLTDVDPAVLLGAV